MKTLITFAIFLILTIIGIVWHLVGLITLGLFGIIGTSTFWLACIMENRTHDDERVKIETLRLAHLSTNDEVLVIKGKYIGRKGIIKVMFEDYDWHCGVDFGTAHVLLEGEKEIIQFFPETLEVINEG